MLLVEFSSDWADEFTAEGLAIMTEEEYENVLDNARAGTTFMFGTNEGWEDGDDLEDCFSSRTISSDEEATLRELIPDLNVRYYGPDNIYSVGGAFGQFPTHFKKSVESNEEDN